ncbi:MAG: glycosyltransferase family 2 protein [Myxococcaceae bacterium]
MRVLVIVPAFNEERNLPSVLLRLRQAGPSCDVCVVDDGSNDATAAVAARFGAVVLRCPVNLGIGGAVQTGYLWARDHGYEIAVQVDGDGQHDPQDLPALIAPIEEGRAEVVIGSRFLALGGFRSTLVRRAGIRYLSCLIRARFGIRVSDPTSGFRGVGRRAIELFAHSYPSDYPEPEAAAWAMRAGLRVMEVPVSMSSRVHGESSIGAFGSVYYFVKVSLALLIMGTPLQNRVMGASDEADTPRG